MDMCMWYLCIVCMCTTCTHAVALVRVHSLWACMSGTDSAPTSPTTILHYWWVKFSVNLDLTSLGRLVPARPWDPPGSTFPKLGLGYSWAAMSDFVCRDNENLNSDLHACTKGLYSLSHLPTLRSELLMAVWEVKHYLYIIILCLVSV